MKNRWDRIALAASLAQVILGAMALFGEWEARLLVVVLLLSVTTAVVLGGRVVTLIRQRNHLVYSSLVGLLLIGGIVVASVSVLRQGSAHESSAEVVVSLLVRNVSSDDLAPWSQSVAAGEGETIRVMVSVRSATDRPLDTGTLRLEVPATLAVVSSTLGYAKAKGQSGIEDVDGNALFGDGLLLNPEGSPSLEYSFLAVAAAPDERCVSSDRITAFLGEQGRTLVVAFADLSIVAPTAECSLDQSAGGWYGERPLWDWKLDRQGPTSTPVLNSYINTPSYGFEPAFFDAARSSQTDAGSYRNVLAVGSNSDLITFRIYVVNSANENVEPSLTAVDTTVRVLLPTGLLPGLRARAYISSSNAVPDLVEDTLDLTSDSAFRLEYVPGSTVMSGLGLPKSELRLPDGITSTEGIVVGSTSADGRLEPGSSRAIVVEFQARTLPE